jgi:hypothetical protein
MPWPIWLVPAAFASFISLRSNWKSPDDETRTYLWENIGYGAESVGRQWVEGTSIKDITDQVSLTKAAFYAYFQN